MSAGTSGSSADGPDDAGLVAIFSAKARAELELADRVAPGSDTVASAGDVFAAVMLVKGDPGPAEIAGGAALSGPDGEAARKALEAIGFGQEPVFATVARPEAGIEREQLEKRLRGQIEAIDPYAVIALDRVAAELLAEVARIERLAMGRPVRWMGRVLLAVDGLESSLVDDGAKRRVWNQLKGLAPRRPAL